jgi:hypothetical protein
MNHSPAAATRSKLITGLIHARRGYVWLQVTMLLHSVIKPIRCPWRWHENVLLWDKHRRNGRCFVLRRLVRCGTAVTMWASSDLTAEVFKWQRPRRRLSISALTGDTNELHWKARPTNLSSPRRTLFPSASIFSGRCWRGCQFACCWRPAWQRTLLEPPKGFSQAWPAVSRYSAASVRIAGVTSEAGSRKFAPGCVACSRGPRPGNSFSRRVPSR